MNPEKIQEHMAKETLKQIVDNTPTYTDRMKQDLKIIIDAGRSSEEILEAILAYFAAMRFY